ncbi:MAG: FAD-dependent oxidoreductase [Flavobacteriales bacterium]
MLSYWEKVSYTKGLQDVVIGGGIVGLFTALYLRRKHPSRRVLVIEGQEIGSGASSRNAGFACFGSASEIISDLKVLDQNLATNLIRMRWEGLANLRQELGDEGVGFRPVGGYELFREQDLNSFHECVQRLDELNKLVQSAIGHEVYKIGSKQESFNGQSKFIGSIENQLEGSVDTGKMMWNLKMLCLREGVEVITGSKIHSVSIQNDRASFHWLDADVYPERLFVCTNGFTKSLLPNLDVKPARNQVIVTTPLKNPIPKGTFHVDEGFVYFREVDTRILIGGFRNVALNDEFTMDRGLTDQIQLKLTSFVSEYLTDETFKVDHAWSGTMGVSDVKMPIIEQHCSNLFVGVRMGGMGVAIGSLVGKQLADLAR